MLPGRATLMGFLMPLRPGQVLKLASLQLPAVCRRVGTRTQSTASARLRPVPKWLAAFQQGETSECSDLTEALDTSLEALHVAARTGNRQLLDMPEAYRNAHIQMWGGQKIGQGNFLGS